MHSFPALFALKKILYLHTHRVINSSILDLISSKQTEILQDFLHNPLSVSAKFPAINVKAANLLLKRKTTPHGCVFFSPRHALFLGSADLLPWPVSF